MKKKDPNHQKKNLKEIWYVTKRRGKADWNYKYYAKLPETEYDMFSSH